MWKNMQLITGFVHRGGIIESQLPEPESCLRAHPTHLCSDCSTRHQPRCELLWNMSS